MPADSDISDLEKALPGLARSAHSLEEIEASIKAHPCVKHVELGDYLMKSNPPQRDFFVECETEGGLVVKKIVNVTVLSDHDFEFNGVRDG
jgi:hypothetical protein